MKRPLCSLLATFALFAGPLCAQLPPTAYTHHWQPQSGLMNTAFTGPGLFGSGSIGTGAGALRRCYGIDSTQGGVAAQTGLFSSQNFRVVQGWGGSSAQPGVQVGQVSVLFATDSDLGGDACFAPFFSAGVPSLGVAATANLGLQTGTMAQPFPFVWQVSYQWTATGSGIAGAFAPINLGSTGTVGGTPLPLLTNVIFEVQTPLNAGAGSVQYYMASTGESPGDGGNSAAGGTGAVYGTGGVTNGNAQHGASLFGVDAAQSGALSHSRLMFFAQGVGLVGTIPGLGSPGDVEFGNAISFESPTLWGIRDGDFGSGGNDWLVSSDPVSVIDLRFNDHLAGGQANLGVGGQFAAAAANPNLILNRSVFAWSATPSALLQQQPMSWDDLGGAAPPQPGSIVLGSLQTQREGPQTLPIAFDLVSSTLLGNPNYSLGSEFTRSADPFLDGGGEGVRSYLEGVFTPITRGVSGLANGSQQVVSGAVPSLAGVKLGVAAFGIQVDGLLGTGGITEVSHALTVNLQ